MSRPERRGLAMCAEESMQNAEAKMRMMSGRNY
jgi:hypothetical protein